MVKQAKAKKQDKVHSKVGVIVLITALAILAIPFLALTIYKSGLVKQNIDLSEDIPTQGITFVSVDVSSTDVEVYSTQDNQIKVNLLGYYLAIPSSKVDLSTEKVGEQMQIKVSYPITVAKLMNNLKLKIGIPKMYSKDVKVISGSGDIDIKDLKLNYIEVGSNSGGLIMKNVNAINAIIKLDSEDTFIENLIAQDANIFDNSGDIKLTKANTKNVNLETTSGEIEIEDLTSENMESVSDSGHVNVKDSKLNGGLVQTNSGILNINSVQNLDSIKSSSGDIDVKNCLLSKAMTIESYSGDIDLELLRESSIDLRLEIGSGEVINEFGQTTGGKNKLTLKTSSGDITLTKK